MSTLRCPKCDYDVRASVVWRDTVRCPECGMVVTLDALAAHLVRRRRKSRSMWLEFAGAIGLMMMFLLINIVHDAPRGMAMVGQGVAAIGADPALVVTLVMAGMMFTVSCRSWEDLGRRGRPLFVAGAVVVVLTLPPTGAVAVLLPALPVFCVWWWREDGVGASKVP